MSGTGQTLPIPALLPGTARVSVCETWLSPCSGVRLCSSAAQCLHMQMRSGRCLPVWEANLKLNKLTPAECLEQHRVKTIKMQDLCLCCFLQG